MLNEPFLLLNRRNGTAVGQCTYLRHQIPDALGILVSNNASQFNGVQEGIKAHSGNIIFTRQDQRRNLLRKLLQVQWGQGLPPFLICIQIDKLQMLPDREVLPVQLLQLEGQIINQGTSERCQFFRLILQILKLVNHLGFQAKNTLLDRCRGQNVLTLGIHAKKIKVPAEVKDIELRFVLPID